MLPLWQWRSPELRRGAGDFWALRIFGSRSCLLSFVLFSGRRGRRQICGSLQAGGSSPPASWVGLVEEGWCWRWPEAEARSSARLRCLRRMAYAVAQQGCSGYWLRSAACLPPSSPAACCWCVNQVCCVVVPGVAGVCVLLCLCSCGACVLYSEDHELPSNKKKEAECSF